jgi:23S rRNA (cytidine1920-2'-O)/16S rRNA (cytidine1409-2'-O)-methyltransferase
VALKTRLDKLLVDRGLVPSRERAQALIIAGKVLVNEQKIEKPGTAFDPSVSVRLLAPDLKYVSRGGLKLEKALTHWNIKLAGKTCLDVGASTGGFTDCLLQHGAARVIAVDTGYGQMDLRIRTDDRVRLLEKRNARYLTREQLRQDVHLIVIDVSFISLTMILAPVIAAAFPASAADWRGRELVVLIKPQFEVGRAQVGKRGVVRDPAAQASAVDKVKQEVARLSVQYLDVIESPIQGAEGNREFLLYAKF